jgi:threonine synthase
VEAPLKYVSTLGGSAAVDFRTALFRGLAADGSLYAPESLPRLSDAFLASLADRSLHDIAVEALAPFVEGIDREDLAAIVARALDFPIPLTHLIDRLYLLELFHGPTLAFKDVGARFMAQAMSHFLSRERREVAIVVATSGDTGSAVAHGFFGVPHIEVYVLYPKGRVSELQELQMATLGGNIHAIEVEGSFDDCQRLVKRALVERPGSSDRELTTANSINVGRLLPQVAYYLWALAQWRRITARGAKPPHVVVPSGNFGNLTAAAYARAIGCPMGRLVAATNANDVVPEYLRTGRYAPRVSVGTLSNAMDVGDPSNLARLRALFGEAIGLREGFEARAISDSETLREIRAVAAGTGTVLDPHTAVGMRAARQLFDEEDAIVAATAHPAKFPEVMRSAFGHDIALPPALAALAGRRKISARIPADDEAFRALLAR